MTEIIEQLDELVSQMDEDDLTEALPILNAIAEAWEDEDGPNRSLLLAFAAGRATAPDRSNDTDLLVGITPEDAATLVAGLLGDGATLTLSVVRHG